MGKLPLLKPLQICLSKIKGTKINEDDIGKWRFSCGHPKTQSFSLERSGECTAAGEAVYQNFNSLYVVSDCSPEEKGGGGGGGEFESRESQRFVICYEDGNYSYSCQSWVYEEEEEEEVTSESSSYLSDFFSESSRSSELPAGLAGGLCSERFFFPPAGRSNSILEEAGALRQNPRPAPRAKIDVSLGAEQPAGSSSRSPGSSSRGSDPSQSSGEFGALENPLFLSGSVAVPLHSPNPYLDFRQSMQEMVEAHNLRDWPYLQEMLLCYLRLNKKKTHKFIVGAFADLLLNIVVTTTPLLEYAARKDAD